MRDAADRAQEELEKLRAELGGSEGLRDSVGVGKGREARLTQRLEELEQVGYLRETCCITLSSL